MKILKLTTLSATTATLILFSAITAAYNEIVPITGSDVSLMFQTQFNIGETSPTHQFKSAPGIFMVPAGKKLLLRSVGCKTKTNGNNTSMRLNNGVKVRVQLFGYRSESQDHFGNNPYGEVPIVDNYGSVPNVTNQLNYKISAVLFERAFITMQTELFNANKFNAKSGATAADLDFIYYCTVQGNLSNM